MKHIYLLIVGIFLLSACNNESPPEQKKEFKIREEKNSSTKAPSSATPLSIIPTKIISKIPIEYTFTFEDLEKHSSVIKMKEDVYDFTNIQQPIVMVTLFSTWCPPCRGQIPHLSNLQQKFKKELFILGALVHDDIKEEKLKKFIISEKALFYISNNQQENLKFSDMITPKLRLGKNFPMPLMILFFHGKYFTHYEGSMPEEMIQSDIEQLIEKMKKG